MDPFIGAAAIGAGANILGGLFGFGSNKDTNQANMELAKYNWEQSIKQWERENEYNKPINQMARLREGGLNPNLVYGNGATTLAASSPKPQLPHLQPYTGDFGIGAAGNALATGVQLSLQNKLNQSQVDANSAAAQSARATANNQNAQALNHLDKHDVEGDEEVKQSMRDKIHYDSQAAYESYVEKVNDNSTFSKKVEMLDNAIELQGKQMRLTEQQIQTEKAKAKDAFMHAASLATEIEYNQARTAQINYELSTNPDPEKVKALKLEQVELENKAKSLANEAKEIENFINRNSKYGQVFYEYFPILRGFASITKTLK